MKKNVTDWLSYLESLNPHKIQLGLHRVAQVAGKLQINHFTCPIITVTGTNGKGSTVAFLESIYRANNYRTGAYTSPHLFQFNERIRINGQNIDDENLIAAFAAVESARDDIALTYFEFTTLAALKIFKETQLDVLILEVGLGGRLDAVNIIDADIAVITAIGIDHVDWLGNDRDSIAQEKAGIFRSKGLAICGDPNPPQVIYDIANHLNTKIYVEKRDFSYERSAQHWNWQSKNIVLKELLLPQLPLENAATSLMVIHLLQARLPVNLPALQRGLKNAYLPGRFQKMGQCIFDAAHNPHAAAWLAKRLRAEACKGRTLAVVGMLSDKDISGTLQNLRNSVDVWYVGRLNEHPRGAAAELLCNKLAQLGINQWYNCGAIIEAYETALQASKPEDRVVIFGSFYTISLCMSVINIGAAAPANL